MRSLPGIDNPGFAVPRDYGLIWTKYTLTEAAFTAAAMNESVTLFTLPAGGVIHGVKIKHSTAFSGGGAAVVTISVGIVGNTTKYASAFDVFQATGATVYQLSTTAGGESHAAPTAIVAELVSDVNVGDLTAGSVDIWVLTSKAV